MATKKAPKTEAPAPAAKPQKAKLTKVHFENIRGFKMLQLDSIGTTLEFSGPNGAGKSDALKGIRACFDPGCIDGSPLTYGAPKGSTETEYTMPSGVKMTIRRTYAKKEDGSIATSVEVLKIDGAEVSQLTNAKEVFRRMVGDFADVQSFLDVRTESDQRKLATTLLRAAGVDLAPFEEELTTLLADRVVLNREVTGLRAQFDSMPVPRPGLPDTEETVSGRAAEISAWKDQQRAHMDAARKLQGLADAKTSCDSEVERLTKLLADAKRAATKATADLEQGRTEFEALDAPPTTEEIAKAEQGMAYLETLNREVRAAALRRSTKEALDAKTAERDRVQAGIDAVNARKREALQTAKLPDPDLAISEDGLLSYRGIGLHELSDGQRMLVGVAVAGASAGGVGVLYLERAESVDAKNMAKAGEIAASFGCQLVVATTRREATALVITGAEATFERASTAA